MEELLREILKGQNEIKEQLTETNTRIDKLERTIPAMEKRIVEEINLQVRYVLEDIEKTESRIVKQIKTEALIAK